MPLELETEVKLESEPCVVAWDKKLFIGCEDGSIKSFDANLSPSISWVAHSVQPFALAVGGGRVYSVSNDGGARVWSGLDGQKIGELPPTEGDPVVMRLVGSELYVGDEAGHVTVFENNELKARYNLVEEVRDLAVRQGYLFTVRDLDLTITEITPDASRKITQRWKTLHTMQGRAPIALAGDRLLLMMARGGNNLQLVDATVDSKFKKLDEVKVSDMIVTSVSVSGDYAWTGGWDGTVRRWKISDRLQLTGELNLGSCVNCLVATEPDTAYAVLTGGRVVQLKNTD